MLRQVLLLAIAIFLLTAPEPDSQAISQMSASFIVLDHPAGLMAAVDGENLIETQHYNSIGIGKP